MNIIEQYLKDQISSMEAYNKKPSVVARDQWAGLRNLASSKEGVTVTRVVGKEIIDLCVTYDMVGSTWMMEVQDTDIFHIGTLSECEAILEEQGIVWWM